MHKAWVNFATNGDPAHPSVAPWSQYDTAKRPTMIFASKASGQASDPFGEERRVKLFYVCRVMGSGLTS